MKRLRMENRSLRKQIEVLEAPSIEKVKSIDSWKSGDFFDLFSRLHKQFTGKEFKFRSSGERKKAIMHMGDFRSRKKITNREYAEFIRKVFVHLVSRKGWTVNSSTICSSKVYDMVQEMDQRSNGFDKPNGSANSQKFRELKFKLESSSGVA